jgi:hypothetical protein
MSATPATVEQLIRDLLGLEDVGIGTHASDSLFSAHLGGKHGPVEKFSMGWRTLEEMEETAWLKVGSEQWTFFTRLGAVQRVRFERGPDPHAEGKERLLVLLFGQGSETLGFSFGHLYDEQGQPIAARFALWEELRAKYGGRDELRVENGRIIPLAEGES